jgi:hypothetical protein
MTYSIIQPPFTLKFREMSFDELKEYRKWFLENMSSRLLELQRVMSATVDYKTWKADFSVGSIEMLGMFLARQVETRPRTSEEVDRIKEKTPFHFDASEEELTIRTFSLAMDAGIYMGETLRHHYPHLAWSQPLGNKKFADFGQMVLTGLGKVDLNPVAVAVTFCYGVAKGSRSGKRFADVYSYWADLASKSEHR